MTKKMTSRKKKKKGMNVKHVNRVQISNLQAGHGKNIGEERENHENSAHNTKQKNQKKKQHKNNNREFKPKKGEKRIGKSWTVYVA